MIIRQGNWLGQQRVDAPHIRAMESSVAADFDVLAGQMLAGAQPLVLKGLNIITTGAVGAQASSLQVRVAGALLMHMGASEAGTIFSVPASHADESLSSTNPNVSGSFTASQTNYVGLDLRREADDSTSDNVQFLEASTFKEVPKTVPLARTLNYRFVISTTDFASQPNVLPIAKVTTDANNNVSSVQDARHLLFRLGEGGDFPDTGSSYAWPGTRYENASGDVFAGGDKAIGSLKDWMNAIMSRLWEVGGGEYWYSATADRNVTMIWVGTPFATGENFLWAGGHLHWKGLKFVFDNSAGHYNDVKDQTANSTGLTDLADGECLYVDLDRTRDLSGGDALVPAKAALVTLGTPLIPGSRQIIAWRVGANVFTRNWRYAVGTTFTPATTTSTGVVRLNATPVSSTTPDVAVVDSSNRVVATGLTRGVIGVGTLAIGAGANDSQVTIGKTGALTRVAGTFSVAEQAEFDSDAFFNQNVEIVDELTVGASVSTSLLIAPLLDIAGTIGIGTATGTTVTLGRDGQVLNFQGRWQVTAGGSLAAVGGFRSITNVINAGVASADNDAANKVTARQTAMRSINAILNGGFDFWQRGTSFTPATFPAFTYTADRWVAQQNDPSDCTISRQTSTLGGQKYALRFQRNAGDTVITARHLLQEIDRDFVRTLFRNNAGAINNGAALTFWLRVGADFTGTIACRLVRGDGTETNLYRNGTGYTNALFTWSAGSTTTSTTWTKQTFYLSDVSSSTGADPTQMSLEFIWNPTAVTAGANEWFEIGAVMLSPQGADYPDFIPAGGSIEADFRLCERYFEKTYAPDVAPGGAGSLGAHRSIAMAVATPNFSPWPIGSHPRFRTQKRAVPTVKLWNENPVGLGTPNMWKIGGAGQASAPSNISVNGFVVENNTGGSFTPTPSVNDGGHWTAEAEMY